MAEHYVTVEFSGGYTWKGFACRAPAESLCRAMWHCDCESWYDTQIRNGVPAHRPDYDDPDTWHAGEFREGSCGLKEWFEGDGEALEGEVELPVEAIWKGDYYRFEVAQ